MEPAGLKWLTWPLTGLILIVWLVVSELRYREFFVAGCWYYTDFPMNVDSKILMTELKLNRHMLDTPLISCMKLTYGLIILTYLR